MVKRASIPLLAVGVLVSAGLALYEAMRDGAPVSATPSASVEPQASSPTPSPAPRRPDDSSAPSFGQLAPSPLMRADLPKRPPMAPAPPPASTPAPPAVAAAEPPAAEEKPTPASEDAAYLSMKEMIKAGNAPAAREAAAMFYRRYPRSHMSERIEHLTGARPGADTFRGPRRPMPTRMEPVLRPGGRQ